MFFVRKYFNCINPINIVMVTKQVSFSKAVDYLKDIKDDCQAGRRLDHKSAA